MLTLYWPIRVLVNAGCCSTNLATDPWEKNRQGRSKEAGEEGAAEGANKE